jgi:hypothetical protein
MPNPAQRLEADLLSYPGMLVDETVVWRAWALLHQKEYDRFDHNLRIGPGKEIGASFLPAVQRAEFLNSQMRIDSVGWQGIDPALIGANVTDPQQIYNLFPSAQATIFEVKRRATLQAVGEIAGYNHAWRADFPSAPDPLLVIICAAYSKTILPAVAAMAIQIDLVQANFSILSNAAGS